MHRRVERDRRLTVARPLPSPVTTGDMYLAAIHDELVALRGEVRQALDRGRPVERAEGVDGELREPASPQLVAASGEAGEILTEPAPPPTRKRAAKKAPSTKAGRGR